MATRNDTSFSCWARLPGGQLERFDVAAADQTSALRAGFVACPRASSMSCRQSAAEERRHG